MKKLLFVGVAIAVVAVTALVARAHDPDARWYIGSDLYEVDGVIYATGASVSTHTVSGKTTLNGELEVNNSDVDINMTLTGNKVTIDQTNAAGTASTPLIKITDARTGATANEASEATLHITAAGAYGLTVADGIVQIEGEIDTASGDITLDPAGGNVIVDGDVDADSYTANAGEGLDVKSAGSLLVGRVTASSVEVGRTSSMTTVKGTLNVDEAATLDSTLDVAGSGTFAGATTRGRVDGTNLWEFLNTGTHRGRLSILKDMLIGYGGTAGGLIVYTNTTELFKVDIAAKTVTLGAGMTLVAEAGAIDATDLAGDIDGARMSANGVVAADFTQDSGVLVGTGAGTYAEETGDTLRTSLGLAIGTDVLAPNGDGTNLTGVALDIEVWGAATVTIGGIVATQRITTNSIAMLDIGGNAKSDYALVRVWTSEAAYGAASTNNIESLVLSEGSAVATETANADYWYVTSSGGAATATITGTAAGTNYLNVSVGANVTAEAIVLTD